MTSSGQNRFAWRAMTSVLIATSFVILVLSGIMLFVSPPGRIANWTDWTLLGLRRQEWIALHICFSLLFLVVAIVHIVFNWRPMVSYFKNRMTRRAGFRWEWLVGVGVCVLVFAGTRLNVPPFSSLLAFNEQVKGVWDTAGQRAPIPHAELLTLAELAKQAGVDTATATSRLQKNGIVEVTPEIIVRDLAERNQRPAQQIYEIILGASDSSAIDSSVSRGLSPGAGGGPGWMTLAQYCSTKGIKLEDALARLERGGIKAAAELTLREIAVNNGINQPHKLLGILEGESQ